MRPTHYPYLDMDICRYAYLDPDGDSHLDGQLYHDGPTDHHFHLDSDSNTYLAPDRNIFLDTDGNRYLVPDR